MIHIDSGTYFNENQACATLNLLFGGTEGKLHSLHSLQVFHCHRLQTHTLEMENGDVIEVIRRRDWFVYWPMMFMYLLGKVKRLVCRVK